MQHIKQYLFHETKYGDELLIDVVRLSDIQKYILATPVHSLLYYDITFITGGTGIFSIDNQKYTVTKGDVVFSSPNRIRQWDVDNIPNGYALIFEEKFLLTFFNDQKFVKKLSFFDQRNTEKKLTLDEADAANVLYLIMQIDKEIKTYQEKDKHILRALLYQVLKFIDRIYISQYRVTGKGATNRHVDEFIEWVDKDFKEYHSPQHYADKLHITPNHLNELVKSSTGISAKQTIQNKLVQESQKLLLYTNDSVAEIAYSLNFESASYFVRFFRKQTGQTPLQYRNSEKA